MSTYAYEEALAAARQAINDEVRRQQATARQRDRALVALRELEEWATPMPGANQAAPVLKARELLASPYKDPESDA